MIESAPGGRTEIHIASPGVSPLRRRSGHKVPSPIPEERALLAARLANPPPRRRSICAGAQSAACRHRQRPTTARHESGRSAAGPVEALRSTPDVGRDDRPQTCVRSRTGMPPASLGKLASADDRFRPFHRLAADDRVGDVGRVRRPRRPRLLRHDCDRRDLAGVGSRPAPPFRPLRQSAGSLCAWVLHAWSGHLGSVAASPIEQEQRRAGRARGSFQPVPAARRAPRGGSF
jgi:hypothetical protein